MTDRWALYVDVEGFGSKWNETTMDAFRGINTLMECIFKIGTRCYPEPPERIFAHQFGDGFLVASDFHESALDRAVLVGVALLRQMLAIGETAKCAIDEGEISDIANCYPDAIRTQYNQGHISLGAGLMTITPIMGSGLIRTSSLHKKVSGPLLIMRRALGGRLSATFMCTDVPETDLMSINWLQGEPAGLDMLQMQASLPHVGELERLAQLRQYIVNSQGLSLKWRSNAERFLLTRVAQQPHAASGSR